MTESESGKARTVDLILLGGGATAEAWPLGAVVPAPATIAGLVETVADVLKSSTAAALLFWHDRLGWPDSRVIASFLDISADVAHGGLLLGQGGLPRVLTFASPLWMLGVDADPRIASTSWRISLSACFVKRYVIEELGFVDHQFGSLEAAALELGHRWIHFGALIRHVPAILPAPFLDIERPLLSWADEMRFSSRRFGRRMTAWVTLRALFSGAASPLALARGRKKAHGCQPGRKHKPLTRPESLEGTELPSNRVTILIPTLNRPAYLRTLLDQVRRQTVRPEEIIVIDQTPIGQRDPDLAHDFADLPLRLIYQDQPGQCSSRNQGLLEARGDVILFLDDDDEIGVDLIENHLRNLAVFRADVSSGVAHETGAGPLPEHFTMIRAADVFPTNNTMIAKRLLCGSGLFDLAFERGQRADWDLGMRIYLSGALMILNPEIAVLHHHAPVGGLRTHKARVVTFASSRQRLLHRHLPSVSEIYLAWRYYGDLHEREMVWLRVFGTFMARGSLIRRFLKILVNLALLPHTMWTVYRRRRKARGWLRSFPQIPDLPGEGRMARDNS